MQEKTEPSVDTEALRRILAWDYDYEKELSQWARTIWINFQMPRHPLLFQHFTDEELQEARKKFYWLKW